MSSFVLPSPPKYKISSYFDEMKSNDIRQEAIVIYNAPEVDGSRIRGRLRVLQQRLNSIKARISAQRPIGAKIIETCRRVNEKDAVTKPYAITSLGNGVLPCIKMEINNNSLAELAENPEVRAVIPNQRIQMIQPKCVNYTELAEQETKERLTWGLQELAIPDLWKVTTGEDINVAVLDTGVHGEHPALSQCVRTENFVIIDPLGRRITTNKTFDSESHGTHVCGTIAGNKTTTGVSIGVAPKANLLVAGVLMGDTTISTLIEGISWAVENGADIINMSLGFSYYEPLFDEILSMLINNYGVLPVVAIGNENHGNCSSPGNACHALAVGAVEKMPTNDLNVAFFSSGASLVFPGKEPNALVTKPDVTAPGVQVFSCVPPTKQPDGTYEYTYMDGTSMATPHVAGVAALLMAAKPDAPVTDVIQVLKDTAKHPDGDARRPDNRWGYGIINPSAALSALS